MRIIAGKFKNKRLFTPKGLETRPTSGKLREAVFNMLQHSIEGAAFLDIFAGSGAMGFEALSRGAGYVVFLDKSRDAVQCITKNIDAFNVKMQTAIVRGDVFRSLEKLKEREEKFDIIYVDPPYALGKEQIYNEKVLTKIDEGKFLNDDGKLFIEENKEVSLDDHSLHSLKFVKRRNFGHSSLFHFENPSEEN